VRRVRRVQIEPPDACVHCGRKHSSAIAETNADTKTINIKLGLSRRAAWVALTHELLHALEHETRPNSSWSAAAELFIERIDDPLFAVLHELGVG